MKTWFDQFVQHKYDRLQNHVLVKEEFLAYRERRARITMKKAKKRYYPTAKWITFCRYFMSLGCRVYLDEVVAPGAKIIAILPPRSILSKFIRRNERASTVRFAYDKGQKTSYDLALRVINELHLVAKDFEKYFEEPIPGCIVEDEDFLPDGCWGD